MWWPRASIRWAVFASGLVHVGGMVVLSDVLPALNRATPPAPARDFTVELEPLADSPSSEAAEPQASAPPQVTPGAPESAGVLDRAGLEGRGGELSAADRGALLIPFISPLTLQDTELNNLDRNQAQRIQTASSRATLEQRRATPSAADAVLLASGALGGHQERRAPSPVDAVVGAPKPLAPSAASVATPARQPGPEPLERPSELRRAAPLRPAQGIAEGRGSRASLAAKVTFARPSVDPGPAATVAEKVDSQVRDDVDAELLAAKLQRSLVDTSVQRAQQIGAGTGGAALAPHAVGNVGEGAGARARPYTPGAGKFGVLDTGDARYVRWFNQQRARVERELAFPRARALAKDQGVTLYQVVLRRDGSLSGSPRLLRSSGYADFDEAASQAIDRSLPFAPLPDDLAPELMQIPIVIPVTFANPMVE